MGKLDNIENRIASLISAETRSWKAAYFLIKEVEAVYLWKDEGYRSFSEWMRHVADDYGISEMYLWKIRSAGDVYARYEERNSGNAVSFQDCSLSMESMLLLKRMGHGEKELTDHLFEYAEKHKASTSDISKAWEEERRVLEEAGTEAVMKNGYGNYGEIPDGLDPIKLLEGKIYPPAEGLYLSDQGIANLVHRYLGASITRTVLENALQAYTGSYYD